MTNDNRVSSPGGRGRAKAVREVEAALQNLHSDLRAVQRESAELAKAREAAIEEALVCLGSEVLWLDPGTDISLEWEGASNFEATLTSDLDDLEAALGEFLDGGDLPSGLPTTLRRSVATTSRVDELDVEESLRRVRLDFVRTMEGRAEQIRELRSRIDDAWLRTVNAIRAWLREPAGSPADEWGRVQVAWRSALGLRGNQAAEILGISAPAVTRYENGSRTPSLPYIESMVERIVAHGAQPSQDMALAFQLAEAYKVSVAEVLESTEARAPQEVAVRDQLIELIDTLEMADVKLLVAIASSHEARSVLHSLPGNDHLAPLRRVLNDIGRS